MGGTKVVFEVVVRNGGEIPELRIRRPNTHSFLDEDKLQMTPAAKRDGKLEKFRATWKAPTISSTVRFSVACGDAKSPDRTIRILPIPAIRGVRTQLSWPKYTHRGTTREQGGHIEGVEGAVVTVIAEANLPVSQGMMNFAKSSRSLLMEPKENTLTSSFVLRENDSYNITFTSTELPVSAKSINYNVRCFRDISPKVELVEPVGQLELPLNEKLRVTGEVSDDFGISRIELVCTKHGGETVYAISSHRQPGRSAQPISYNIPVTKLGNSGDVLKCFVRAWDFCPQDDVVSTGQMGKSKTFIVKIIPPDNLVPIGGSVGEEEPPAKKPPKKKSESIPGEKEKKEKPQEKESDKKSSDNPAEDKPDIPEEPELKTPQQGDPEKDSVKDSVNDSVKKQPAEKEDQLTINDEDAKKLETIRELLDDQPPAEGKDGKGGKEGDVGKAESDKGGDAGKDGAGKEGDAGETGEGDKGGKDGKGEGKDDKGGKGGKTDETKQEKKADKSTETTQIKKTNVTNQQEKVQPPDPVKESQKEEEPPYESPKEEEPPEDFPEEEKSPEESPEEISSETFSEEKDSQGDRKSVV